MINLPCQHPQEIPIGAWFRLHICQDVSSDSKFNITGNHFTFVFYFSNASSGVTLRNQLSVIKGGTSLIELMWNFNQGASYCVASFHRWRTTSCWWLFNVHGPRSWTGLVNIQWYLYQQTFFFQNFFLKAPFENFLDPRLFNTRFRSIKGVSLWQTTCTSTTEYKCFFIFQP